MGIIDQLYGGGGKVVSADTNRNGASYTFGDMYAQNGAAPAQAADLSTAVGPPGVPSAEYQARMAERYNNAAGIGPRPSMFHQWSPMYGWQFIAEYSPGNSIQDQISNMTPAEYQDHLKNGFTHQLSPSAQAIADAQGIKVSSAAPYGGNSGIWNAGGMNNSGGGSDGGGSNNNNNNNNGGGDNNNNGGGDNNNNGGNTGGGGIPPLATAEDIEALYQELLGRSADPAGLNYWLNSILEGGATLADVRYNITQSAEYQGLQGDGGTDDGGTDDGGSDNGTGPAILGWYWSKNTGVWAWSSYSQGEAPPSGSPISLGPDMPNGQPANWVNPDDEGNGNNGNNNNGNNNNGNNNNGGTEEPPPNLYTPTGDQFYKGMFTANDMLFRDGGTVDSGFYNGLRQNILASLAQMAADNGRTQNTAEEIAMFGGPSGNNYSAQGMFSPSTAGLSRQLGY